MEEAVKYHINDKGKPGVCRAQKRCRFGDLESEHYGSKEEAQKAFEVKTQAAIDNNKYNRGPLGLIPTKHRNFPKTSDAFYNTTGIVDPEAINYLADYFYYKEKCKNERYDSEKDILFVANGWKPVTTNDLNMLKAKELLLNSEYGKDYKGFEYDDSYLMEFQEYKDFNYQPFVKNQTENILQNEEPQTFKKADEVRVGEFNAEEYSIESAEWLKKLTPQEHSLAAYWTSAGAHLVGELLYEPDADYKPKGELQNTDPTKESYVDSDRLVKTLNKAINKSKLPEKRIFYRGVSDYVPKTVERESYDDERPLTEEWLKNKYAVGSEVTFGGPMSSSADAKVAHNFARNNIVFEIQADTAAPVGNTSAWGLNEREYILPSDHKYKVKAIQSKVPYQFMSGLTKKLENSSMMVIQLEQLD